MEKKDLGLGIGATLLGIATMVYFFNIPPKSAFFPKMISGAIIIFAFQYIGYTIPTFLLIMATSVTLGYKKWKVLVPAAVLVSIGLYLAFTQVFNIRFMGMFF
ncbi:MAG: tripartite tricarboxylate transporter TctB family protein [Clostridiales bacterium]|nr:tripartite tricarboxylate transporter TctB family protein [Clostridiales bacterium]